MICPQCQAENRDGAAFCKVCGAVLLTEEKPEESSAVLGQNTSDTLPLEAPLPAQEQPPIEDTPLEVPVSSSEENLSMAEERQVPETSAQQMDSPTEVKPQLSPPAAPEIALLQDSSTLYEGYLLADRYKITKILTHSPDPEQYEALDLYTCWSCGSEQTGEPDPYCEACGAEMSRYPTVRLTVCLPAADFRGKTVEHDGKVYSVENIEPAAQKQLMDSGDDSHSLILTAGFLSDVGMVRDVDEDSILILQFNALCETKLRPAIHFFAVADGIGGSDAGEIASRIAVQKLAESLMQQVYLPGIQSKALDAVALTELLVEVVKTANTAILEYRQQTGLDMGSTLTAALVFGKTAVVANLGDSRTYQMRNGTLTQITRDHSLVAGLLQAGVITADEVYTHPQRSVIYRSLGDKAEPQIDTFSAELAPGDRLVLCCDGVWEMVRHPDMESILLQYPNPQDACRALVTAANAAGGEDNISIIVVNVAELK